ncbi:lipopolysaccharide biosynthesis protein [Aliiglaciecola sp. M165]|uniref:lipopolysaccharide biosynthesis protein n=1 Tax=Aliiglaciecola sp. M165 TaxID=2593649 RepID=UPI0011813FD0|nr:lipopolysaccharide biosynthesis protein [Aliiglaciecola sp. M165]TRY30765.1 lipopolysaccharide biosynthesis protein [Aliiglaciecola sp. M165]
MSMYAQKELEKRLLEFKRSIADSEWSNEVYLKQKIESFEEKDVELAFRIMQRVKVLNPSDENQRKLQQLGAKALESNPDLKSISTVEKVKKLSSKSVVNKLSLSESLLKLKGRLGLIKRPFYLFVLLPFLILTVYFVLIASPRYESQTKFIVKEPDGLATLDPAMAVLSGFGVQSSNLDTELVQAFINSNDMMNYLEERIGFRTHFSDSDQDFFSRLSSNASIESQFAYFLKRIEVEIDQDSQIISVFAQGFDPVFAKKMTEAILERAEWYINEIGHLLAKEQMAFVMGEHELVEKKLQGAKSRLLDFQRQHAILDPEAEGLARQQITYQLEGSIAAKRAEVNSMLSSMSNTAPAVVQAVSQLNGLIEQLKAERAKLANSDSLENNLNQLSIGEILAKFSDYKIDLELALQAYAASQVSIEKSRIEAYRQLKYLVVVESPTTPENDKYPDIFYNLSLAFALLLMLFGIGKIIIATVEELR